MAFSSLADLLPLRKHIHLWTVEGGGGDGTGEIGEEAEEDRRNVIIEGKCPFNHSF